MTDTNDGQKPFMQEKSLLQLDWSIALLVPNSVSTGMSEMQLDWIPQSPHPSHTSVLMNIRVSISGNVPRLRLRLFSAAQVCR